MNIPLARPDITDREIEVVVGVLRSPYLALGPKLKAFEKRIAEYAGVEHAVATNSGTSALHLIIRGLGVGPQDEVITTPFSFIASANCILFERAQPVFVDICPDTLCIDPDLVEKAITSQTKAILAVDVFGHPADWNRLEEIATKYDLKLIEDSAEALGSEYNSHELRVMSDESNILNQSAQAKGQWKKAGSFGNAGVFAFYPNKQITTGEGGVVVTDDPDLATLYKSMANQGRSNDGSWLDHVRLGYNYRMDEMSAVLGLAQLSRIDEIIAARAQVANWYTEALLEVSEIEVPTVASNVRMSWFVYVVQLSEEYTRQDRDRILQELKRRGIGCSNYFQPIHLQPFYRQQFGYSEGDFPITESIAERTIALPFYNQLARQEVKTVTEALGELVEEHE